VRDLLVQADGGSRGNPGLAGAGAAVIDGVSGQVLAELGVFVGVSTNNVAEYHGLIAGLKSAYAIDEDARIHVQLDSKLIVEQMSGRWKIKHPDMQQLAKQAFEVIGARPVVFEWIPREKNTLADSLANRAMDDQQSFETLSR
jgi:ribonuclease HI